MTDTGEAISPEDEKGPCATRADKVAAFASLTPEVYGKLLKFAEASAMKFRGKVIDSDAKDLLHEAVLRSIDAENTRKWYPQNVDFLTFFRGVIRSIASDWYKRAKNTTLPDELLSPTRHDAQTEAAMMLEKIRESLRSRPHAVEILDLKCSGLRAKEIQERLGINEYVYAAAVKWIERTLREEGFRR